MRTTERRGALLRLQVSARFTAASVGPLAWVLKRHAGEDQRGSLFLRI